MEEEHTPERLVAGLVKLLEVKDQGQDQFLGRKSAAGLVACLADRSLPRRFMQPN